MNKIVARIVTKMATSVKATIIIIKGSINSNKKN